MSRFLRTLDTLIAGGTLPSTSHADELRDYIERHEAARAGRAEGARQQSAARSEAIRARIRAAVGAMPLTQPPPTLVGIVERRMRPYPPSARTIRDELRAMRAESRNFGTETTAASAYASTIAST